MVPAAPRVPTTTGSLTACNQPASGNAGGLLRAAGGTFVLFTLEDEIMIIPTRLKKIAQICETGSSRYTLENVHIRKRNKRTELTATNGKSLLRFYVPADDSNVSDCETQIHAKDFKRIVGATGTIAHKVVDQPNGVVKFEASNRDGTPGPKVEASTESAGRYPDADRVLDKPIFDSNQEERIDYRTHRLDAGLLKSLLEAVVASGGEYVDLVTAGEENPVYIDGVATGKHDDHKVEFRGILMTCRKV